MYHMHTSADALKSEMCLTRCEYGIIVTGTASPRPFLLHSHSCTTNGHASHPHADTYQEVVIICS